MASGSGDRNPFKRKSYRHWFVAESFLAVGSSVTLASTLVLVNITGSVAKAGVITGFIAAGEILLSLFGGGLSDIFDRRTILRRTILLSAFANFLLVILLGYLAFFPTGSKNWLQHGLLVGAVAGCILVSKGMSGMAHPVLDGSVKMLVTAKEFPRVMGAAHTRASTLNIISGPTSGGLYGLFPPLPFILSAACDTAFLLTLRKIPENLGPTSPGGINEIVGSPVKKRLVMVKHAFTGYREAIRFLYSEQALFRILLCAPLVNLMVFAGTTWIVLHLTKAGVTPLIVGATSATFAVGSLIGSLFVGPLTDKIRPGVLVIAGLFWVSIGFGMLFFFPRSPLILGAIAIFTMLPSPALNAGLFGHVFQRTSANMQGRIMATFTLVGGLAAVVAPIITGLAISAKLDPVLGMGTFATGMVGVILLAASKNVRNMK